MTERPDRPKPRRSRRLTPKPTVNTVLSEAGRRGARQRWGPPRHARLDDLTPDQRRLVLALIDAARSTDGTSDAASERPDSAA